MGQLTFQTGRKSGYNKARIDPLVAILAKAHSSQEEVTFLTRSKLQLLALAETLRGEKLSHVSDYFREGVGWRKEMAHQGDLLTWADNTPLVKSWLKSPEAFYAPASWPEPVKIIFDKLKVTPYDIANSLPPKRLAPRIFYEDSVSSVCAYSCGVDIPHLSRILECDENETIRLMVEGARALSNYAPFLLWVSPYLPELLPLAGHKQGTLFARLKWRAKLLENPLLVPEAYLRLAVPEFVIKEMKQKIAVPEASKKKMRNSLLIAPPRDNHG